MSAQQRIHLNPNAPRAPMMPMGGGYQPDPIGRRSPSGHRGGAGLGGSGGGDDLLGKVQQISSKVEDVIEAYTQVSVWCLVLGVSGRCCLCVWVFGRALGSFLLIALGAMSLRKC